MKKHFIFLAILALIVNSLFADDPPPSITAFDAGNSWANGEYTYQGTSSGKPYYYNSKVYLVWSYVNANEWEITDLSSVLYYNTSDTNLPPESGWLVVPDVLPPAPTLSGGVMPVELIAFTATLNNEVILLNWQTATEVNNYGFQVQREKIKDKSEEQWINVGFVQGSGTTNSPKEYSFIDSDLPNVDEVNYRLKQIDNDGTFNYSKTITVDLTSITSVKDEEIPTVYSLSHNYPNPFNPSTTIKYQIAAAGMVTLKVLDILGNEVATLVNKEKSVGSYQVSFNASGLSSGIYFYQIKAGNFMDTKKMMLLK